MVLPRIKEGKCKWINMPSVCVGALTLGSGAEPPSTWGKTGVCSLVSHYTESCTDPQGSAAGGTSLSSSSSGPCDGISGKQLWTSLLLTFITGGPLFARVCFQKLLWSAIPMCPPQFAFAPHASSCRHQDLYPRSSLIRYNLRVGFPYKIRDKRKTSYFRVSIKVDMTWGYITNVLNY